jgi:hypothetical protein
MDMKLRYWIGAPLAFAFVLCGTGFTQGVTNTHGKTAASNCRQFTMRIITPVEEHKYTLIVVEPTKDVEAKGMVVNPCQAESQPTRDQNRKNGFQLPTLKLKLDK